MPKAYYVFALLLHTIDERIFDLIVDFDSSIGMILGGRRKGKSLLGYGIIDELSTMNKMDCCEFGLPISKEKLLPPFIKPIRSLEHIPDGTALICDEAYKEFYSRQSMSDPNKFIDTLVALSGQKDLKCLYITQQARRLDRGIVGGVDFVLFKKPSLLQMKFDRPQFKTILKEVYEAFKNLHPPEGIPLKLYQKQCTYVLSEDFVGMIENSNLPPEWWNEQLSKAYAGVPLEQKRIEIEDTQKEIVNAIAKYIGGKTNRRLKGYDEQGEYTPRSKRG